MFSLVMLGTIFEKVAVQMRVEEVDIVKNQQRMLP